MLLCWIITHITLYHPSNNSIKYGPSQSHFPDKEPEATEQICATPKVTELVLSPGFSPRPSGIRVLKFMCFRSDQISCSVMSGSLQPHGL